MASRQYYYFFFGALLMFFKSTTSEGFSNCGERNQNETAHHRTKRVIGGNVADQNSWPWMISFTDDNNEQQCAGSIINENWILTAAHCFLGVDELPRKSNTTFHVADHQLNVIDSQEIVIKEFSRVYYHPRFRLADWIGPGDNDIALVKLKSPLNLTAVVKPVCLPEKTTEFTVDDTCYVIGWGNTIDVPGYHRSNFLKEAKVDFVPLKKCNSEESYKGSVSENFVCAGFEEGGVDGCYGDSGGPLQCLRNNTWFQLGIMIWGLGCAEPNHYGVYSDVRKFLQFIEDIQKGENKELATYFKEKLSSIKENQAISLFELLTNFSHFSDIDLVRNLPITPNLIRVIKNTTLKTLQHVSKMNFSLNTNIENISMVILTESNRLRQYHGVEILAKKLNITIQRVLNLSHLSEDNLLDSPGSALVEIEKSFYIRPLWLELLNYKNLLLSYDGVSTIMTNKSVFEKDWLKRPLEEVKMAGSKELKQYLAKDNKNVFTESLTVFNLSVYFEMDMNSMSKMTFFQIFQEVLNFPFDDFVDLHRLTGKDLYLIEYWTISSISDFSDKSLLTLIKNSLKDPSFGCGYSEHRKNAPSRYKRVVGGDEATENSWPWIINFLDKDKQMCAGSIINHEWILTAAHCYLFDRLVHPISTYTYHAADHALNTTGPHEILIEPSELYVHPKFKIGELFHPGDYDIALLKLKVPLKFNRYIHPACFPEVTTEFTKNDTCYVIGWGNTVNTPKYHRSPVLKEAKVNVVPLEECNSKESYKSAVSDRFLCAGFKEGGVDGCYGDSGGPLQCWRNDTWFQLGIMIWGLGCAEPNHYGVYSDTRRFLSFIETIKAGPNESLQTYLEKTLDEANRSGKPANTIELYELFTNNGSFSNVDLVKNFQVVPYEIEQWKETTMKDVVFVTNKQGLLDKLTPLKIIIAEILKRRSRMTLYTMIKRLSKDFNISINNVLKVSNSSKNQVLDSIQEVDSITKRFYGDKNLKKVEIFKAELLSYNKNLSVVFDEKALTSKGVGYLKELTDEKLKKMMVKNNEKLFIENLAVENISAFFHHNLTKFKSRSVFNILRYVMAIDIEEFVNMYGVHAGQLVFLETVLISEIPGVELMTISTIFRKILESKGNGQCREDSCSEFASCKNIIGSFLCRCKDGYVGDGDNCQTGNTMFKSTIRFDYEYSSSLEDMNSHQSIKLADTIEKGLSKAIEDSKSFRDFRGTQVTSFEEGSVVANYVIVFASATGGVLNRSQIYNVVNNAAKNGDLGFRVLSLSQIQDTNLCVLGSLNCHKNAKCVSDANGHMCKCVEKFVGDGVTKCIDPCANKNCGKNSYCLRKLDESAQCVCNSGYSMNGDGECKEEEDYLAPLIAVSCVAGVLVLMLILYLCSKCFCKNRKQKTVEITDPTAKAAAGSRGNTNTAYDDINLHNINQ